MFEHWCHNNMVVIDVGSKTKQIDIWTNGFTSAAVADKFLLIRCSAYIVVFCLTWHTTIWIEILKTYRQTDENSSYPIQTRSINFNFQHDGCSHITYFFSDSFWPVYNFLHENVWKSTTLLVISNKKQKQNERFWNPHHVHV